MAVTIRLVLVAGEDRSTRFAYTYRLRKAGVHCEEASSRDEARAKLASGRYHLAVLDLGRGNDLAWRGSEPTRFLLLQHPDEETGVRPGHGIEIIHKPVDIDLVDLRVREILDLS